MSTFLSYLCGFFAGWVMVALFMITVAVRRIHRELVMRRLTQ